MKKVILDCDPGHDDALAILLAHAHPSLDLLAVTTVAGNQILEKVTQNARKVMTVAGIRNTLLAAGADRPLVKAIDPGEYIHGVTGLDGYDFPAPTVEVDKRHAADLIIELCHKHERVTLIPTAPLTNIAMALRKDPRILPKIEEIVLMGGGTERGNREPLAEFNIWQDPEAADIIFRCGRPVTMVGLNLTHQAKATVEVVRRIQVLNNEVSRMVVALLDFFRSTYEKHYQFDAPPIHDACAVARVIDPEIIKCAFVNVSVELRGTYTYGATVCDTDKITGRPPNANVATELNKEKFWELMIGALASYK
ncbi:MAG TPA: nucleoside hydrolase [Candidatus Acidoferrum sp.]|nr:nucleoside hydrolase [Candidatus Acidoferrum sp.]